jgi:hypothetical protein
MKSARWRRGGILRYADPELASGGMNSARVCNESKTAATAAICGVRFTP